MTNSEYNTLIEKIKLILLDNNEEHNDLNYLLTQFEFLENCERKLFDSILFN